MNSNKLLTTIVVIVIVGLGIWIYASKSNVLAAIFSQNYNAQDNPTVQQSDVNVTIDTTNQDSSAALAISNESNLRVQLNKLFVNNVIWERAYMAGVMSSTPDVSSIKDKIVANQQAIADAVRPYYGDQAATEMNDILKRKVAVIDNIIVAIKNNDQQKFAQAGQEWQQVIDQLATAISQTNDNIPKQSIVDYMNNHLVLVLKDMNAIAKKNSAEDMQAFDAMLDHALTMSEVLSSGIVMQFPDRF